MTTNSIPSFSIVTICIAIVFGFLIPACMFIFLHKKYGIKKMPFFTGCVVFIIFAIVLEGIAHSIILGNGRQSALMAKPLLFALYGGFMAGLFEETRRLLAFKFLLKKNHSENTTALAYGAGHGGVEAFYLLTVTMITNLALIIIVNTGNLDKVISSMDQNTAEQFMTQISSLYTTNSWLFLASIVERLFAVTIQISLSVLIYFCAINKKLWYLYFVAFLLHMIIDLFAGIGNMFHLSNLLVEILICIFAVLCALLARFVWKKEA